MVVHTEIRETQMLAAYTDMIGGAGLSENKV